MIFFTIVAKIQQIIPLKSLFYRFDNQFNCSINLIKKLTSQMNNRSLFKKLHTMLILPLMFLFLMNSCGIYKPVDARKVSPNPKERVKKNLEEGKGFTLKKLGQSGTGTNFEFASAKPLWRASLDVLDFLPLSNVDYAGGLVITDWYSDNSSAKESIKITIRFLSNEIRADGIDVIIHKKICDDMNVCNVVKTESLIQEELKLAILKRATMYEKDMIEKIVKENKKNPGIKLSDIKKAIDGQN